MEKIGTGDLGKRIVRDEGWDQASNKWVHFHTGFLYSPRLI